MKHWPACEFVPRAGPESSVVLPVWTELPTFQPPFTTMLPGKRPSTLKSKPL